MNCTASIFNKVLALCERNSILTVEKTGNAISNVKYGPLGYLLKRNIFKEWLHFLVNHNDAHVFPIQIQEPKPCVTKNDCISNESFSCDIFEHYEATLPLVSHHLPFGLAVSGKCINNKKIKQQLSMEKVSGTSVNSNGEKSPEILWNLNHWSYQALAFFCDPKKSMHWFYYWQRQRHVWWRKFSAVPSNFSLSDMTQTSKEDHQVSVHFQYPWGKKKLETINVFGQSAVKNLNHELPPTLKSEKKTVTPSLILCETNLDLAVLTYLCDTFEEKWLQDKQKMVLRLNHKLCPYKTSIALNYVDQNSVKKLTDVSNRLIKELKQKGIIVFPNPHIKSHLSIELQFEQFDEMGIPYTIVLTENSLITGIAGLRNRDTTLQEKVHIMELTSKIVTYLLMSPKIYTNS